MTSGLRSLDELDSLPLTGVRLAIIEDTIGAGVSAGVTDAILAGASHFEALGATVDRITMPSFALGLPAYYVIASSEASSNLSRFAVRLTHTKGATQQRLVVW